MSNRDALRNALDSYAEKIKPARVEIPEIGQAVYIRKLTLGEVEEQAADSTSKDRARLAYAVARVLVDDGGKALYNKDDENDIKKLSQQPWPLINRILEESNKVNSLSEEGVKAAEKN